jgi:hypothetical protein
MIDRIKKAFLILILGILFQVVGTNSNIFVIKANNDSMPVWNLHHNFDFRLDSEHCVLTHDSRYIILSDILPFPIFTENCHVGFGMESIGDLCIDMGQLMLCFFWVPFIRRKKSHERSEIQIG